MQEQSKEELVQQLALMQQRIAELENMVELTQRSLLKAERKYHHLFENAGDSIFIIDAFNFKIISANGNAARRLGYQVPELLQLTLNDLEVLDENGTTPQQPLWKSAVSQTVFYECSYRRKDDSLVPVEVSSRLVSLEGRMVLEKFVRDITFRKELEAARKEAEAEALRLATVIQQATEAVMITDLNANIVYVNPHFEVTTGYTAAEALGKNPRILQSGMQDKTFYQNLWGTISHGENWHGMFTNRRKDGTLYYEEATIFPIRDREEHITHYAAVKRDITEDVLADRERDQLITELDAFAHTVAHDLKAPLMLVRGYSSLLLEDFKDYSEAEIREMLEAIDNGGAKMVRIVDELLILASTRQSADVPKTQLDMIPIVNEALSRFQLMIGERQAEIVLSEPEKWPVACGYGPWVEEVWANYISNAIKYGGEVPHIELGAALDEDKMVRFWVRDNGKGIDLEKQHQLFKPFIRLSEIRVQGYGLGLSIVQRIVNKLGGEVGVESTVGEGSTFYFTLPSCGKS